ncbi:MAG: hypothetical protein U0841_15370 [Chloroflexia bacterium]
MANLVRAMALGTIRSRPSSASCTSRSSTSSRSSPAARACFFMVAYQPYLQGAGAERIAGRGERSAPVRQALAQIGAPSIGGALVRL